MAKVLSRSDRRCPGPADVWWYDPDIVSGAREVDVLSLYLQFRDNPDERLEAAAEQLLEEFAW